MSPPSALPLTPGMRAPGVPLPRQATVLLFASSEWNPAQNEQMTQFYNALVQSAAPDTGAPPDSLRTLQSDGNRYRLHFDGQAEPTEIVVLPEFDSRSETAAAYGVYGQTAVFVTDSDGIIRFAHTTENAAPRIGAIVDALREMHAPVKAEAPKGEWRASRRDLIAAALAGAFALTLGAVHSADASETRQTGFGGGEPPKALPGTMPVMLKVNGTNFPLNLDPRVTLLDALRETIGLTGSKKGCDHGQCGACTVHIDGQRSLSCLALAAQQEGSEIVTIEGLAKGDTLHPVQQAFLDHDGYQCGYCTPGQIMSAVALIREGGAKTDREIREGMSGNLCRCAAYPHIVEAVKAARDSGKRV